MKKVNITICFDDEKLDALEFSLKKGGSSVQSRMEESLQALYEKSVAEPVREYLDSKASASAKEKAKRPIKPVPPKAQPAPVKPMPVAQLPHPVVEEKK